MEWREIEIFLTLAEEQHFGRTAQRLQVSAATVTQTIQKLERRVGAPLFERNSRRVAFTPIGREFYDELLPGYRQIEQALASAVAAGRGITGTLRVGFSMPWCGELMARAATAFHARYPDCEVEITAIQLSDYLGPLRAGRVDLQLCARPVGAPDMTLGPVLFREPWSLMVPVAHPFAARTVVTEEDLGDAEIVGIGGDFPKSLREKWFPSATPSGRPISRGLSVLQWQEVIPLVSAGRGVSPAPARTAMYYATPGIAFVPLPERRVLEFGLMWPDSRESARVRAFVDIAIDTARVHARPFPS